MVSCYLFFWSGTGLFVGWAVSLFTRCGRFDTKTSVQNYIHDHGCFNLTNCDLQIVKNGWSRANDYALRACFAYCGTGAWVGVVVGVSLVFLYGMVHCGRIGYRQCRSKYEQNHNNFYELHELDENNKDNVYWNHTKSGCLNRWQSCKTHCGKGCHYFSQWCKKHYYFCVEGCIRVSESTDES